jgi:homoserine kinase
VRSVAMQHGARAGGISGSGPSTFWIARNEKECAQVASALKDFMQSMHMDCDVHQTRISSRGSRVIE